MKYNSQTISGALLFIGAAQFLFCLVIASALYPNYSISQNMISDLGVGSTALLFNGSILLFGLVVVTGSYYAFRAFNDKVLSTFIALSGIGAIGVGLFPETLGLIHFLAALVTFLFGALSAIAAYRLETTPLEEFSILLGVISLTALGLSLSHNYLGLGPGGMERLIVYPVLLWVMGFGGYLMHSSRK